MGLLEREVELAALSQLFASAADGRGSVALVSGEAGIGKTSLVGAAISGVARAHPGAARRLRRPDRSTLVRPVADAARGRAGPLAAAVAAGADRDAMFEAVFAELERVGRAGRCWSSRTCTGPTTPRWISCGSSGAASSTCPLSSVLTFRDDELAEGHPLRRLLGALVGPHVSRLPLARLSPHAVHAARGGRGVDGAAALAATAGNPFFLAEVLANPGAAVPPTVADAVLARVMQLDAATRSRVEQLAVVVAPAARSLVEALPGGTAGLVAAERLGIVEFDGRNVVFRHDLARRAIEASLPGARRIALHRLVLGPPPGRAGAGPAEGGAPRRGGGQRGGDRPVRAAGRSASRARGANRQALAVREQMLRHADLLAPIGLARVHIGHAWSLFNAGRYGEGLAVAERGVTLWEALDDLGGLSEALVTLGRQLLLSTRPRSAEDPARRALAVLDGQPPGYPRVLAGMFLGAQLVLTDQPDAALPHLEEALELALAHSDDMIALCRSYVGLALAGVGDPRAADQLVKSLEPTATPLHHERRVRVLRNVADGMRRLGRWQDERHYMAAAIDETSRYDPVVPVLEFHARHWALVADGATGPRPRPGCGRCWKGRRTAADSWSATWCCPSSAVSWCGPGGSTRAAGCSPTPGRSPARPTSSPRWRPPRSPWPSRRGSPAGTTAGGTAAALVLERADGPGDAHYRGELLRQLRRLGEPVPAAPDVPPEWAGCTGRRRRAEWETRGQPYERALELIDSDEPERSSKGSLLLDGLGARPPRPSPARGCGSWASPASRGVRARRRGRTSPG